jgi:magnesium transporter
MDADPPVVAPGIDREMAAWKSVRHGEGSLAVVDAEGAFVGLLPPARLLGILLSEHEQDAARLGGYLHDTAAARLASEERVARRLWHRLPWLLLGLIGAIAAAEFVGAFEAELEQNVVLAFFLPSIVYLADAVGTQTETLMVRGLSVGVTVRHVIRREVITGLVIGVVLALAFFPFAALRWDDTSVATTISLALLLACSTATAVAMVLPWLLHRLGSDPAFASGPLGTVIQDLLSIVIYLLLARALVG